jgi:hypothetical protein
MHRFLLALMPGVLLLGGCSTHMVDIDGEDRHVEMPEGELVVSLGGTPESGPNRRENALAIGYTVASGDFEQELEGNEYVDLQDQQISGPATLDNEAELGVGYVRFMRHMYNGEQFNWYWGAGLGYSNLEFTATDGSDTLSEEDDSLGLHGLVGLRYQFHPLFGIEGNVGGYYFGGSGDAAIFDIRGQFILTPVDSVKLFAGYRHLGYRYDSDSSRSDILFDYYGPAAGISLKF